MWDCSWPVKWKLFTWLKEMILPKKSINILAPAVKSELATLNQWRLQNYQHKELQKTGNWFKAWGIYIKWGGNQLEDVSIQPFCVFWLAFLISRNTGISQQRLILLFLAKLQFATSYSGSGARLTIKHIPFPGSFPWEPHCGFDCRWSPSRHADSQALVITAAGSGLNPCSPYRRLVRHQHTV